MDDSLDQVFVYALDDHVAGEIQRGVRRYLARQGLGWPLRLLTFPTPEWLSAQAGQVYLLGWRIGTDLCRMVQGHGWLVAELSQTVTATGPGLTHVWPDDHGIGTTAADYVVKAGFRQVVVPAVGSYVNPIRHRREQALIVRLRQHGIGCEPLLMPESPTDGQRIDLFRAALDRLARPAVLFTYQDRVALWHLSMLQQAGFAIPDDLGILGVDDSPMAADSVPGLTSVRVDWSMIADRALQVLHRQRSGLEPSPGTVLVPICSIKERGSTQLREQSHPLIRRAHRLIEQALPRGLSVAVLARRLAVTPAQLAWHCAQVMQESPGRWIRRRRLDCACDLLMDDGPSVAVVARRCGFVDPSHLTRHFLKAYGRTPAQFRMGR